MMISEAELLKNYNMRPNIKLGTKEETKISQRGRRALYQKKRELRNLIGANVDERYINCTTTEQVNRLLQDFREGSKISK